MSDDSVLMLLQQISHNRFAWCNPAAKTCLFMWRMLTQKNTFCACHVHGVVWHALHVIHVCAETRIGNVWMWESCAVCGGDSRVHHHHLFLHHLLLLLYVMQRPLLHSCCWVTIAHLFAIFLSFFDKTPYQLLKLYLLLEKYTLLSSSTSTRTRRKEKREKREWDEVHNKRSSCRFSHVIPSHSFPCLFASVLFPDSHSGSTRLQDLLTNSTIQLLLQQQQHTHRRWVYLSCLGVVLVAAAAGPKAMMRLCVLLSVFWSSDHPYSWDIFPLFPLSLSLSAGQKVRVWEEMDVYSWYV